jgi:glycosyltransferase involved in cell wall biosynthesis
MEFLWLRTLNKRILYAVSEDWYFWMHRMSIALEAKNLGYEIHVIARPGEFKNQIVNSGIIFHDFQWDRKGINPIKEIINLYKFIRLLREIKPNILHNVSLKISILGTFASFIFYHCKVINSITGLGYLFTSNSLLAKILKYILIPFVALPFRLTQSISFCENDDDALDFKKFFILKDSNVIKIAGTGVDLNYNLFKPLTSGINYLRILCASRILKSKGFVELSEILKTLKKDNIKYECLLVGMVDDRNPDSLDEKWIRNLESEGIWKWEGFVRDVRPFYEWSNLVVLLSYREGLPVSLLEAMGTGRAILTTNVRGCNETVHNYSNGILIPPYSIGEGVTALEYLSKNLSNLKPMGKMSRSICENKFSRRMVNDTILSYYQSN